MTICFCEEAEEEECCKHLCRYRHTLDAASRFFVLKVKIYLIAQYGSGVRTVWIVKRQTLKHRDFFVEINCISLVCWYRAHPFNLLPRSVELYRCTNHIIISINLSNITWGTCIKYYYEQIRVVIQICKSCYVLFMCSSIHYRASYYY